MTMWRCQVCGYVHNGSKAPALCPVCEAGVELFSPMPVLDAAQAASQSTAALDDSDPRPVWRCTVCDYVMRGEQPPERCPVCEADRSMFKLAPLTSAVLAAVNQSLNLVIVGAGIAGLSAAEQARAVNAGARITLINDEWSLPYYRINLTRLLAGEVPVEALPIQSAAWYEEQRIELVYGRAEAIERENARLRLHDGRTLRYDRLLLCTGAESFVPPIPGADLPGVAVLRSLEDAKFLLEQRGVAQQCVCIGGGLLGLECAGALRKQGFEVTVLEGFDYLMPRQLSRNGAARLRQEVEALGIAVVCGAKVQAIRGTTRVSAVELANGQTFAAQLVVITAGIRPRLELAKQAQLAIGRGLLVDERMCTNDPKIFAAGDGCEHDGVLYGIWPASTMQGLVAGRNAAGANERFAGLAHSTRLKVLGSDIFSVGKVSVDAPNEQLLEHQRQDAYASVSLRDGVVIGATLLGDVGLASTLQACVEAGHRLEQCPELELLLAS